MKDSRSADDSKTEAGSTRKYCVHQKANTMRADAILGLVRRLIAHEARASQHQNDPGQDQEPIRQNQEAVERVLNKLRLHLSKTIGQEGFRTLLARALTLTTPQFPNLGSIQINADGSLNGMPGTAGVHSKITQNEAQNTQSYETPSTAIIANPTEGATALLAHLIALLVTFIGEDLTLRILSTLWPELAFIEN